MLKRSASGSLHKPNEVAQFQHGSISMVLTTNGRVVVRVIFVIKPKGLNG
ncbi:hypothetical protein L1278_001737 [Pontibacter sp. HSC-36F09]|nr:hypothetical protein [Pontibacter sp. HSC-36F09]